MLAYPVSVSVRLERLFTVFLRSLLSTKMNAPITGDKPTPPANVETSDTAKVSALSVRALGVGVVCVALTCVVVCYAELVVGKIQIGFLQMPPVVVGMLVLLLGVQALFARFSARLRLRAHEMFT